MRPEPTGPLGRENTGVVIVDHGSRRTDANAHVEEVARAFADAHAWPIVEPAHMELAEPSVATAFERCVACGATFVVVCPFFLLPGRHVTEDIPALAADAATAHPGIRYAVGAPVGVHPAMVDVIASTVMDSLHDPSA